MADWAVFDDFFPDLMTGFRIAEYNEYLRRFPTLRVLSTCGHYVEAYPRYAARYPELAPRVDTLTPKSVVGVRFAYMSFLDNAQRYLQILTHYRIPFVLTLYPGGGFGLDAPESDAKLARVCASPLLQHVIVTQRVTAEYLAARHPHVPQTTIFGCVVNPLYFDADSAPRNDAARATYEVCFVAEKYMAHAVNKGYPTFIDAAKKVATALPDARFHVIGTCGPDDWPLGELAPRIVFHGRLETPALRRALAQMDVVASPNVPFVVQPGAFDGFPTAACVEASLCGVAMVLSDPLALNTGYYVDGVELLTVAPAVEPLADALIALGRDPERRRAIGAAGRARSRALYAPAAQIDPRIEIIGRAAAQWGVALGAAPDSRVELPRFPASPVVAATPEERSARDPLRHAVSALLAPIPLDFGGGCSASKAYVMAALIRALDMKTTLDIGVYRGRSLLPQALAHARHSGGVAYGVDPWSRAEAAEHDNLALKDRIATFVATTDFDAIHAEVERLRHALGLGAHCTLVRATSAGAAERFRAERRTFDLIHIDGNHDTAPVLRDVEDYVPLLAAGGILVMDDVSWDSVQPACARVEARMPRLFQRIDAANDYAVYWNVAYGTPRAPWAALFEDAFVVRG